MIYAPEDRDELIIQRNCRDEMANRQLNDCATEL